MFNASVTLAGEAGAVNPYVLYVHGEGRERWNKGDICVFDITVLGTGTERAGAYLDALQAAEHKGWGAERLSFRLMQVIDRILESSFMQEGKAGFEIYHQGHCR